MLSRRSVVSLEDNLRCNVSDNDDDMMMMVVVMTAQCRAVPCRVVVVGATLFWRGVDWIVFTAKRSSR